ncbi:ABC-2 type transport system ATP-binding protein [Amycolatopsis arida]|uniref:ABC-2 type transport system ATP-binding protein n=1 Tax=Amycolatopsis arida TaxID=587909 RepID=A0A1I5YFF2_9PSEU|nr:ABC transporter ATP-binding protein [Amycolatopsis arida]TDX90477.1 ABC-2 type transport system ATP-binding protein [Amycolatopsis arida]SFQ42951.1 ABC-2 type transport system ATP-binding protein [Amycolatopsis arida]
MDTPVVEVADLRYSYGDFEAVRGVSFQVHRGELFALLGTNGAGKTTTMEIVEGHRAPTAGTVRALGADPFRQRRLVRERCGIMLQESGFAGDLTVAETVRLWTHLVPQASDVDEALARLDLVHRRDVRVKQLSGGEKRRLDLVLATLGRPEVLFLDEPTTGLDPESRQATWQVIRELLADGTTVLLTTHYLEEAEKLAHRLAILHEGRIAVAGSLVEVLDQERAEISFDLPPGFGPGIELPAVTGELDRRRLGAGRLHIRTRDLQRDLTAVVQWSSAHELPLQRFRAHHASLEDVFHAVVDRKRAGAAPADEPEEVTV